jgi:hypothetical protein
MITREGMWGDIRVGLVNWHDSVTKECGTSCGEASDIGELRIEEWSKIGKWVVALWGEEGGFYGANYSDV